MSEGRVIEITGGDQGEFPPRLARPVDATICANEHPRISHRELVCPMCHVIHAFNLCSEHNERLIDEAHYRQAELESARDKIRELETVDKTE